MRTGIDFRFSLFPLTLEQLRVFYRLTLLTSYEIRGGGRSWFYGP